VSVTPLNQSSTPPAPLILGSLPDPSLVDGLCPRRARAQIDLLLLAIEALDIGGSEAILFTAKELDLQGIIRNRVTLWQLRSSNPMRRYGQRRSLSLVEAKALVAIICHLAKRLTVVVRSLLADYHQLRAQNIPLDQHIRLANYLERFRAHFRSRMNPRRTSVTQYTMSAEALNTLALELLEKLLFCTGTFGMQRLWISLFDGEVE